ncbi:MAG TPA: peroxiredoxin [Candidatus Paceibacterota bacterium]|nr:peroxiredoxin [Candidatus Paceibacterota bacterium]
MLTEGTITPPFSLPNAEGDTVSSTDFSGQWTLLYFYPKDDTPGCTKEACAFRDNFPFYEDIGITVVGISRDSVASHKKFKEKYNLPFELLSDTEGAVIETYGAANGTSTKRISYLVDPNGIIAKAYEQVTPATHAETVLKDLKELQGK